jgi:hypothetical protein
MKPLRKATVKNSKKPLTKATVAKPKLIKKKDLIAGKICVMFMFEICHSENDCAMKWSLIDM